jgi:hypothetical protein
MQIGRVETPPGLVTTLCNNDPCFSLTTVQEDAEQGAVPLVRDEPLWEPGFRVHLQHLSG